MKKVLLFSHDPGGANTIIPVAKKLKNSGVEVLLYGKRHALLRYRAFNLDFTDIEDVLGEVSFEKVVEFIKNIKPNIVVTGTSGSDFTEKYLWNVAQEMKIPTIAILDQWINYGVRFSKYSTSELVSYERDPKHDFLPTKIAVMDDFAKSEAIDCGLPESRLSVTGQPYFDLMHDWHNGFLTKNKLGVRERLGILESEYLVTFASEPLRENYGNLLGYDQLSSLANLVSGLSKITKLPITVIVKRHPKESNLIDVRNFSVSNNIRIIEAPKNILSWELIGISDLICGMSSMFLIEAFVLKKPIISIQIGLQRQNPFILDRKGLVKSVLTLSELLKQLDMFILEKKRSLYKFSMITDASDNVIKLMKEVCGESCN